MIEHDWEKIGSIVSKHSENLIGFAFCADNPIIPSQMEVQHRNVALLRPTRNTQNTDSQRTLRNKKIQKIDKKDQGSSGVCRADRTNVGLRAFGAQAGMLRYVVLNACDKLPKNAIRNQNLLKMLQITKSCQSLPLVAKNTQKQQKVSKS